MRTVKILSIEKNPLTTIGGVAGICYGQTNPKRFPNIAKRCLEEDHGRVLEFTNVTLEIDGVSAKLGRELLRHIHMSSLQASTRYIDYSDGGQFEYVTPPSINTDEQKEIWNNTMKNIQSAMVKLKELDVPVEDFTNLLPLAYSTKIVIQINLRSLIHMFHVRSCTTAYHEFRELMKDIKKQLSEVSEEWKFLADNYLVPKCVASGYCLEKIRHCGIKPLKSEVLNTNTSKRHYAVNPTLQSDFKKVCELMKWNFDDFYEIFATKSLDQNNNTIKKYFYIPKNDSENIS